MQQFQIELDRRIRGVTLGVEMPSPQTKMDRKKGEKTLGILPREMQKFWIVLAQLVVEYNKEQEVVVAIDDDATKVSGADETSDLTALIVLHNLAYRRVEYASQRFWQIVREEFAGGDPNVHIALREGWVVALCHKQADKFLAQNP